MPRIINFGVVGCGVIGPTHAEAIRSLPEEAALVACCDIIPERAQAFAEKFGPLTAYTSLDEMLGHPGLDCVCVCTPSGMHGDMILAAADRGINALVEKPMDITTEKLDAVVRATREKGIKVGCIFQRRAWDVVNRIRDVVQSGRLGRMYLGEARMKWYRSQAYYDSGEWRGTWALDGGGALMNQGIHGIDTLFYVMGPIASLKANAATLTHNIEVEDTLTATIRFKSGALGTLCVTTSCDPGYQMRHEFNGDKGNIILEEGDIVEWTVRGEDDGQAGPSASTQPAGGASSDPKNISVEGHTRLVQDMAQAIRDDRAPMIPPEAGRTAVDLILAMYESARTGQEITFS